MKALASAAAFFGTPEKLDVKGAIRLSDNQLSVELTAASAFSTHRIEAPERDGLMICLRLSPTSENITLNESTTGTNIRHSGSGNSIMTAGDTIILRYCKGDGRWHELIRVSH